tara:strand:- start:276 stop:479 length:204 start_codon:yes stop_codon:yes gene_type:complete
MAVNEDRKKIPPMTARMLFMQGDSIKYIAKYTGRPQQEVEEALRYEIREMLNYCRKHLYGSKEEKSS